MKKAALVEDALYAFLIGLTTLSFILNTFSGIVGGIWLAVSGGIWLVIGGIILGIVMPWFYTLAFLPSMGFAVAIIWLKERSKFITLVVTFIAALYQQLILLLWIGYAFGYVVSYAGKYNVVALLLFGYSVMMGPLAYMSSKERDDNYGTTLALIYAEIVYLSYVLFFLTNTDPNTKTIILGLVTLLFSMIPLYIFSKLEFRQSKVTENEGEEQIPPTPIENAQIQPEVHSTDSQEGDTLLIRKNKLIVKEIRTPLTVVKSYVWMVMDEKDGRIKPKFKQILEDTTNNLNDAMNLIRDTMDCNYNSLK